MSKCFTQIGVQNPTTINAFTEAQKFIIISVISKGFSSCLASEFEGFLRTWAKLVTTSNIYLHIKSPLRVPNVFPLSGDSLRLWQSAALVNVHQRPQQNPADWKTFQPLVNTQGGGEGGAKARFIKDKTSLGLPRSEGDRSDCGNRNDLPPNLDRTGRYITFDPDYVMPGH